MVLHEVELFLFHIGQRLLLQDVLSESFMKYFQGGGAHQIRNAKFSNFYKKGFLGSEESHVPLLSTHL